MSMDFSPVVPSSRPGIDASICFRSSAFIRTAELCNAFVHCCCTKGRLAGLRIDERIVFNDIFTQELVELDWHGPDHANDRNSGLTLENKCMKLHHKISWLRVEQNRVSGIVEAKL